jgi:hypothetical protein
MERKPDSRPGRRLGFIVDSSEVDRVARVTGLPAWEVESILTKKAKALREQATLARQNQAETARLANKLREELAEKDRRIAGTLRDEKAKPNKGLTEALAGQGVREGLPPKREPTREAEPVVKKRVIPRVSREELTPEEKMDIALGRVAKLSVEDALRRARLREEKRSLLRELADPAKASSSRWTEKRIDKITLEIRGINARATMKLDT